MKWKYIVAKMRIVPNCNYEHFLSRDELNAYGREGWELVSIFEGRAYFKRPLEESDEE